jgi:hypothetical protein
LILLDSRSPIGVEDKLRGNDNDVEWNFLKNQIVIIELGTDKFLKKGVKYQCLLKKISAGLPKGSSVCFILEICWAPQKK